MAKYCVDGPHDEDIFEMSLFRSHINELLTQKRYLSYAISDAVRSLIFWRGQVKVGAVWLPVHSGEKQEHFLLYLPTQPMYINVLDR